MPTSNEILEQIDARLPEAVTLTVGRMVENQIKAQHLVLDKGAADGFRDQCGATRDLIAAGTPTSYAATAELGAGQHFVIDDSETLDELEAFRTQANDFGKMQQPAPSDLAASIRLYTVIVGNDAKAGRSETGRVLFVRQANPRLSHSPGRFAAVLGERLSRIDEPVFAFSPGFDFVIGPDWAVILNQRSFEMLFREIGVVEQHVATWIRGITDYLPMSQTSIDSLKEVAIRDSRTWRRLRDIERRGHLADVDLGRFAF